MRLVLAALSLAPLGVLAALEPPTNAAVASPAPLGAPWVVKLDWGCDAVRAADIDGDGRTDLALLNRESGRVELLLRRKPGEKAEPKRTLRPNRWDPDLDDAPFRRLSLAGDPDMRSLALGDLAGTGRTDIAYTGGREALTVVFRDQDGEYTTRRTFNRHEALGGDKTLALARLGADPKAKPSLVMLCKDGLLVFPPLAGTGPLPDPVLYKSDTATAAALQVADFNADGRADLAYLTRGDRPELRVRLALPAGGFGPERALKTDIADLSTARAIALAAGQSGFAAVNRADRRMEVVALRDDPSPWKDTDYAPPALHFLATSLKSPALVASLDTTASGLADLLVADPRGAKLLRFRRPAPGADFGEAESFPALAQISALAAGKFDGKRPGLLQLSEKEGILGYSTFDAAGRPAFPTEVKLDGQPLALVAADFSGDGRTEAVVLVVSEKTEKAPKRAALLTLRLGDDGKFAVTARTDLGEPKRDLTGLIAGDLDGDGRPDLVALVERDPARLFLNAPAAVPAKPVDAPAGKDAGKARTDLGKPVRDFTGQPADAGKDAVPALPARFTEIAKDSAQRKSLLGGLAPADLAFGDLLADGKSSLLVTAPGFIRALRADPATGDLRVLTQVNTRRPDDKLKCPVVAPLDDPKRPGLLAYNETDRGFEYLAPDAAGVFRHRRTIETGPVAPLGLLPLRDAAHPLPRLVLIAKDKLAVADLTHAGPRLTALDHFETDLPGTVFDTLETGRFTGATTVDVALFDSRNRRLELVSRSRDNAWRSVLHFELYDENPYYRGRRTGSGEPHDTLSADISAPGASDLILLIHDRLLVYPRLTPAK